MPAGASDDVKRQLNYRQTTRSYQHTLLQRVVEARGSPTGDERRGKHILQLSTTMLLLR